MENWVIEACHIGRQKAVHDAEVLEPSLVLESRCKSARQTEHVLSNPYFLDSSVAVGGWKAEVGVYCDLWIHDKCPESAAIRSRIGS